jgi:sugar/nucleoside kinase (ribokinase family)
MSTVLIVGSVALDTVETRAGRREEILGGSATFASVACKLQAPAVKVVAVVGEDFPQEHIDFFAARGIDAAGIDRKPGRTFRWSGRYAPDFSTRETLDTQLNVFEHFDPHIAEADRRSEIVFLGNILPELQLRVLEQMGGKPRLVAADTMNFWISGKRDALLEVLKRTDMLLINDEEVRQLSGEWSVLRAGRAVQAMGPKVLVVKRGEHGALLFDRETLFYCPSLPLEEVVDPTGAGDTFAGALLGWLARNGPDASLRDALAWATAVASFSVQGFGVEALRDLSAEAVAARVAALRELVSYER